MNEPGASSVRWVRVKTDKEPHQITEYKTLSWDERRSLEPRCLQCNEIITLRLGHLRKYYAHQPDVTCRTTEPESALHLNVKVHIAQMLEKGDKKLLIEEVCSSDRECDNRHTRIWAEDWDRVETEYRLGERRPDITLLKDERPYVAVEIWVKHQVDEEKAAYLALMGIAWLEVEGSNSLYEGDNVWDVSKPLPYVRLHPQPEPWVCPDCATKMEQLKAERREVEQKLLVMQENWRKREVEERQKWLTEEEVWRNNHTEVISYKFIDFYWQHGGKKYRQAYAVVERVEKGQRVALWLLNRTRILCEAEIPIDEEETRKRFREAYDRDITKFEKSGAQKDNPMKEWIAGCGEVRFAGFGKEETLNIRKEVFYRDGRYPWRFAWCETGKRWFLPKDKEAICWPNAQADL